MSGIGLVLNVAKDALAAQTHGIEVTGHNISNVSTPGYSRQRAVYESKEPSLFGGVLLGRGVDTTEIERLSDQFIENQIMDRKSEMLSSKEMENYMQIMEGLFNENSEMSISNMLSDFWNLWQDISNNPSGPTERIALYEHSILLSEQFNTLSVDLFQIERDLTDAIRAGVDKVNQITLEIGQINQQIIGMELNQTANDFRDKRNTLVAELSEYIDVKTFEQSDGSLTIITAKGCVLVNSNNSNDLVLEGSIVNWQGSGGNNVDITNYLKQGKVGGWLDLRDEIIPKYAMDLNAMTEEFIWAVNQMHSRGVGLQLFNETLTGTYETGSSGLLSTLPYGNKIDYTKDFKMWTYESGSSSPVPVHIDMERSTANPAYGGTFNVANTTYTIEVTQGGLVNSDAIQFNWSETGGSSGTATLAAGSTNVVIDGNTLTFTASDALIAGNIMDINTVAGGTPSPVVMTPTGTASNLSDTYTFTVTTGGIIGTDPLDIAWSNSMSSGTFTLTAASTTAMVDGMTLPFVSGRLYADDAFTITTDGSGTPSANLPSEWHWSLDSFINQFNRQTSRVTATKTAGNALMFSPDTSGSGRDLTNFIFNGGVGASNSTITVNNYDALTLSGPSFQLQRTGVDTWTINNDPGYGAVLIPAGGDDDGFGIDLNGNGSADITIGFASTVTSNGYVDFDIAPATGNYSYAFSDDESQDSGLTAALGINTFFGGNCAESIAVNTTLNNKDCIAAARIDADTGNFTSGNNNNAMAISNLQFTSMDISQWTCNRIEGDEEGRFT
ncbi:MAG: flagellar hook-associated protein FlgK, partial [Thermodesulfobacteriota bacterium]|nr:flagellar hook-associated protein FlgK [Thermodesulfobacteriota bacterium]